jgi:hypothetical protein
VLLPKQSNTIDGGDWHDSVYFSRVRRRFQ